MKKRLIAMFMILILLPVFNVGCAMKDTVADTEEAFVTRAQWISGLGTAFGMNDYTAKTPYFDDVDISKEIYPFVQSCAEWEIFDKTGGNFYPNENVTREFAVQTAVMAAEVLDHITDDTVYDECIPYAVDKGIIESEKEEYLNENITYAESQEILEWAVSEYHNREFVEYSDVKMEEDVVDLTNSKAIVSNDTGAVTIPAGNETLQVGDVFIAPATANAPQGVAMKVSSVSEDEEGNQIVEITEPELEEIYENLEFAVRAVPEMEDIVVSEGVTLLSAADAGVLHGDLLAQNSSLVMDTGKQAYAGTKTGSKKGTSFGFSINFTKGQPSISPEWNTSFGKFKADLENQEEGTKPGDKEAGEWFKKSAMLYEGKADGSKRIDKMENKFEGGHEITGSIMIEDFYVDVKVDGLKYFEVKTNYNVSSTLKVEGSIKDEFTISSFHIQTPIPGVTVKVEMIGSFGLNGELEIKFVTSHTVTTTYSKGNLKKVNQSNAQMPDVSVAAEIEVGVGVKAAPCVLGKEIVDVKVKGSIKLKFEPGLNYKDREEETETQILTIRAWNFTLTGSKTIPIVTLEVGTGKKSLIKLNYTLELMGEKGLVKVSPKEMFNKEWLLCEVILERKDKEEEETETIEENEGILQDSSTIDIESYAITLGAGESTAIAIAGLPEGYTEADLRWESNNPSVATVSGGQVTGVSAGSTQIRISTSDGKYEIYCNIIVADDEEIEFQPL